MKKITLILLIILIFFIFFAPKGILLAASTLTPTSDQTLEQKLLNQIASKAAQLHLTEKRGIIGTVSAATDTQITITDLSGNTRFVDVDELTKFSSASSDTFGISDIKNGMALGVLGLYNKDSRRLLARDVVTLTLPKVVIGAVDSIDKKNFQFIVATETNPVKIDVESVTKTYSYTSDGGLVPSGFSKMTVGETVIVSGYPDSTDKTMILSSKTILFPNLPKDPKINSISQALDNSVTIVPSTGSGKKITPIVK